MLNLKKKCMASILCGALMLAVSIPVISASGNHDGDEFNTWVVPSWDSCKQVATFYCPKETHTASVVMQSNGSSIVTTYVGIAVKKVTAKADSGYWYADLKTRRGYYDHRNYMFTPGDF